MFSPDKGGLNDPMPGILQAEDVCRDHTFAYLYAFE